MPLRLNCAYFHCTRILRGRNDFRQNSTAVARKVREEAGRKGGQHDHQPTPWSLPARWPRLRSSHAARLGCRASADPENLPPVPGGTIDEGDFRDRLCLKFAAELEKRTGGELGAQVYPNSSLMKTDAAVLVAAQGRARSEPLSDLLRRRRVARDQHRPDAGPGQLLQAGRRLEDRRRSARNSTSSCAARTSSSCPGSGRPAASRAAATRSSMPADAKGLKIRGGSREMDMMLQAAGAATLSTPSNELYAAMQTGACDAAHHLLDQPDLVPARGGRQEPHHRPRQVLLVHARAADHVEADLRQAAEEAAGRDHGARRRAGDVRHQGSDGRRPEGRRGLCQEGRQGRRSRRGDRRQVARDRPRRPPGRTTPARRALSAELLKLAEGVQVS